MKKLFIICLAAAAIMALCSCTAEDDVRVEIETKESTVAAEAETESKTAKKTAEKLIMDQNGVKIYYKGVEDDLMGKNILLKIENNSSKDYTVQQRDLSINGYMVSGIISESVKAGKKANSDITVLSSDLEENDITDIEEISVSFHVFSSDDWLDTFDSDSITIKLK